MNIFLSYASEDRSQAESIYFSLLSGGHTVFFDRKTLEPGNEYDAEIKNKIIKSDLFIFLVSPHSVDAHSYTLTELKFAEEKWKHPKGGVLPVMLSPTDFENIPGYLKAVTIFQAQGNIAAELSAYVEQKQKSRPSKFRLFLYLGIGIISVLLLGFGIQDYLENTPEKDINGQTHDLSVQKQCENPDVRQDNSLDPKVLSIFKAAGNKITPPYSKSDYIERVQECLVSGMNVNAQDDNKWTALHAAAFNGHEDIVRVLFSGERINIDMKDINGRTPLFLAVSNNQHRVVHFLVESGANKEIADNRGIRPITKAKSKGSREMIKLLEKE